MVARNTKQNTFMFRILTKVHPYLPRQDIAYALRALHGPLYSLQSYIKDIIIHFGPCQLQGGQIWVVDVR